MILLQLILTLNPILFDDLKANPEKDYLYSDLMTTNDQKHFGVVLEFAETHLDMFSVSDNFTLIFFCVRF